MKMKFLLIPYIALGFVLSSAIGVQYYCDGQEFSPYYYGSPFVFKQKSLGSSLTYFYSVFGLLLNIAIWSIFIALIRLILLKLIEKMGFNKIILTINKVFVGVLIAFTTLNISIDYIMLGPEFEEGWNYWYIDMDKYMENWKIECAGEWTMFTM